jgi:hypothetical protein
MLLGAGLYATFFVGLTGSSSSLSVKSMTSDFLLLPVRGAEEASRDVDESGVLAKDWGVGAASVLMADIRWSVTSIKSSSESA